MYRMIHTLMSTLDISISSYCIQFFIFRQIKKQKLLNITLLLFFDTFILERETTFDFQIEICIKCFINRYNFSQNKL